MSFFVCFFSFKCFCCCLNQLIWWLKKDSKLFIYFKLSNDNLINTIGLFMTSCSKYGYSFVVLLVCDIFLFCDKDNKGNMSAFFTKSFSHLVRTGHFICDILLHNPCGLSSYHYSYNFLRNLDVKSVYGFFFHNSLVKFSSLFKCFCCYLNLIQIILNYLSTFNYL